MTRRGRMCFRSHPFLWSTVVALRGDNEVLNGEMAANHDDICMAQERRSSLVLMHIQYQVKIDLDEVVNLFATKHPQRLELGTILKGKSCSI